MGNGDMNWPGVPSGIVSADPRVSLLENAIRRSGQLLDDELFFDWLRLFAPEGRYRIEAYSPDLMKTMTWLSLDTMGLQQLLAGLENHVRDGTSFTRLVSPTFVEWAGSEAKACSTIAAYRTDLDGKSALFAVGKYIDRWADDGNCGPELIERVVQLKTRDLGKGSHVPL